MFIRWYKLRIDLIKKTNDVFKNIFVFVVSVNSNKTNLMCFYQMASP